MHKRSIPLPVPIVYPQFILCCRGAKARHQQLHRPRQQLFPQRLAQCCRAGCRRQQRQLLVRRQRHLQCAAPAGGCCTRVAAQHGASLLHPVLQQLAHPWVQQRVAGEDVAADEPQHRARRLLAAQPCRWLGERRWSGGRSR